MTPGRDAPAPRQRDAQGTRQALLRAGLERFLMHGYEQATTREIAADAGVNVSLISRYFGSKRGLYRAVLENSAALMESEEGFEPHPGGTVASFLDSLDPESWTQYGSHPLTLLVRDEGDPDVQDLRTRALKTVVRRYVLGGTPTDDAHELRAQLVFALYCGIVALRSTDALELLASASHDDLEAQLEPIVTTLLRAEQ